MQFSTSRPTGEVRSNEPRQPKGNNKRQFIQPFNTDVNRQRQTPRTEENLVRAGQSGGRNVQRPSGVPPGVCWVCRQPRCHSRFHEAESQPTPPPLRERSPDVCWTCGAQGCRTWYHTAPRPPTSPVPLMNQNPGNAPGTRRPGNRGPIQ